MDSSLSKNEKEIYRIKLKLRYYSDKRFEQYLNEGKYGEAKIEGMMPYNADLIRFAIRVAAPAIAAAWVISRRRKKLLANNERM